MPSSNCCFLTGADQLQEWLLPWWILNIRKNMPEAHIVVADFGLSSKMRCNIEADLIPQSQLLSRVRIPWFLKPLALLKCNYEKVVWLDTDCQVLKPCQEIFDYTQKDKLALTQDLYGGKRAYWQTGVVGIHGKPDILYQWNERSLKQKDRGDQEALAKLIGSSKQFVSEMPQEYQWLRISLKHGQDSPNKKIIHWTGRQGKKIIFDRYKHELQLDISQ